MKQILFLVLLSQIKLSLQNYVDLYIIAMIREDIRLNVIIYVKLLNVKIRIIRINNLHFNTFNYNFHLKLKS